MADYNTQDNPTTNLPALSAEELHKICKKAFRVGNRARHKLVVALLALADSKLFVKLG